MTHSSAVHARRVELGPPLPAYQVEGVLQGPRVAVDTVREECIEDVADGEDPGLDVEVWSAQRTVSMLGLLAACAVVPGAVVHFFGETEVQISGTVHFLPIAVSAGLAAAAAVALTVAGARRGDARSVLIGTAFSSMAALLSSTDS